MTSPFEQIKGAVANDRYVISEHAIERLAERNLLEWQIVEGIARAKLLRERLDDRPHPVIELEQLLADGTPVKTVWGWMGYHQVAKLVTVHFFDNAS